MKQQTWQKIKQNPELIERYLVREKVIDTIRKFLKDKGFREVQTPILVPIPSAESNLEVFETELRTAGGKKRRGFLIMSPEYALKKLVAAGMGNVFEITRSFRNEEEVSSSHNPEFTMLEWYQVEADYRQVMEDFERLVVAIIAATQPQIDIGKFDYLGQTYDLSLPWPRLSVAEAFLTHAGIQTETLLDEGELLKVAVKKGYQVDENTNWEQMFYQIFLNEIEPKLKSSGRPTIIYDYPLSQAALARKKVSDPRWAERFEVFLAGLELGNCFSELIDAAEQSVRFKNDLEMRKLAKKTVYQMDEDFITALKSGMPELAGIAVGVDRLIMLAANVETIAETLLFPANEVFDL